MAAFIKRHKKSCIAALVVLAAVIAAALIVPRFTGKKSTEQSTKKQSTVRLEKMDLATSVSASGTLESSKSETVSAAVNNITVKKVNFSVGDTVKKGDTLITFDESDLKEALSDADENLSDARSEANRSIASAQKKLADAKSSYTDEQDSHAKKIRSAKKEWQSAAKQVKTLQNKIKKAKTEEKAALQEQLTKAKESAKQTKEAYETAKENRTASLKQSQSNIDSAEEALENAQSSAEKSIREAKNQAEDAKEMIENCSVTAAMDGTVTSISVSEGDVYSGGSIMEIEDTGSFIVTAYIDEYDIGKIEEGQKTIILTEATGEEELEGTITFVAPKAGNSQSSGGSGAEMSSGTTESGYEIQIKVTSKNDSLRLGMTAKCSIILEEAEDVFAVPYDAIHEKDGEKVIYVADGGSSYREIAVTTGMESDYYTEISGSELTEGMSVIIPTDETSEKSDDTSSEDEAFSFDRGGMHGGSMPDGAPDGGGKRGGSNGGSQSGGMSGGAPNGGRQG